jgi:hypothetical protein
MTEEIYYLGNTYKLRSYQVYRVDMDREIKFFWACKPSVGGLGYGRYMGVYNQPIYAKCAMFDSEADAIAWAESHQLLAPEAEAWNDHD